MAAWWKEVTSLCRRRTYFPVVVGVCALLLFLVGGAYYRTSDGVDYRFVYVDSGRGPGQTRPPPLSSASIPPLPSRHQVLLITYGRSGSTFTSALINHHQDVFFTYEPLYVLKQQFLSSNDRKNDSVAIVNAFLTCNFPLDYIYALDNTQHRNSDATRNLYACMTTRKAGTSHLSCFLQFLTSCQNHSTAFVKTIRFKVEWARWFLENYPQFKLLYLVRDPRATLYSQARIFQTFGWNPDHLANVSKNHCSLVADDLSATERLQALYPGRVKAIRYEDGALDPFGYTKDIYHFLGLDYDDEVVKYIDNLTHHSPDDKRTKKAYDVVRANSTATMNKWRYSAGFNNVRVVDDRCGYLYPKLGYNPVESQADLESQRSLITSPDPGGIFFKQ